MRAPSAPGPHANHTTLVSTEHRNHAFSHRDMVAKASAGYPGSSPGPSILRVVPLLRVFGKKGQRAVLVGHSCLSIQDVGHAAVESYVTTRSWLRLHDAAVRQCLEMRKQLDAESASARDLMAAAASVSNSREADSQAAFNTLAAVASLGLGIPALVLALYGADRLLPLNTEPRQLAFIPVAAGLLFAAVIAIWRAPKGKSSRIWIFGAIGIIIILLSLLVAAGLLAPSS